MKSFRAIKESSEILLVGIIVNVIQLSWAQSNCSTPNCSLLVNGAIAIYPSYSNLRTEGLIQLFGYPVERHNITTEDGYILGVQRIPSSNSSAIPVFLMHGIFASSAQWFWQPKSRALVFMLADAGYDVWIGNARGTSYSLGHTTLNSNQRPFWNFSSYEMGYYDIPAVVNYILQTTGQPSLYYIGHSLGGQQVFITLTLRPEMNSKIRTIFALAPAPYLGNKTNLFLKGADYFYAPYPNEQLADALGNGRFIPEVAQMLIGDLTPLCESSIASCGLCSNLLILAAGFDSTQANYTTLPGAIAHEPDSISVKTYSHNAQASQTGLFRQYDYGTLMNMAAYGSATPPEYPWSRLNTSVVMFYGLSDTMIVPKDINKTAAALGSNLKELVQVNYTCWNHLDFIIGKDADIYVYNKIIQTMNSQIYG